MNNQEMETIDYAVSLGFLIGGIVAIVILAVIWFAVLNKKTKQPYPIVQMMVAAIIAQTIGLFAFLA